MLPIQPALNTPTRLLLGRCCLAARPIRLPATTKMKRSFGEDGNSASTPAAASSLAHRRPVGRHGNTAVGRLDRLDVFLQLHEPSLFSAVQPPGHGVEVVVDVGFGAAPDTLLALATRLLAGRPTLCIVGTETDAERLASAQPLCGSFGSSLQLRRGDCDGWFVLPLRDDERRPSFVRCMNVLRDYHPDQVRCGSLALAAGVQLHCIAGCWLTRAMLRFAC